MVGELHKNQLLDSDLVTGFQGRQTRETGREKLKGGQTVWAICSHLVTNKLLSSPVKYAEKMVKKAP